MADDGTPLPPDPERILPIPAALRRRVQDEADDESHPDPEVRQ